MTDHPIPVSHPADPTPSYRYHLPRWLTVGLPVLMLVYPFILMIPGFNWEEGLDREFGLVENLTALFLFVAFIVALRALPYRIGPLHGVWLVLMALGALVFCGEEISWGQHFFGWATPEKMMELNRQHETNIHNLNGTVEYIFTKVLRNALSTGAIVGGLVIPYICRRRKSTFAPCDYKFWLWPSQSSALVGVLVNVVGVPNKLANHFDAVFPSYLGVLVGELKEAFIALFILLYVLTQYWVAKSLKTGK